MLTFNRRLPVTLLILLSQPVFGQVTDTNALACGTANAIVSICRSINPALVTASQFYSSAPCLCYSSTAWAPGIFDHYHSLCYSYLSTASPAYVASATSINHGPIPSDPCRLVGNILTAPVTVTDTALSITQPTDVGYSACQSVGNVVNNCEQLSPGFSTQTDPKTLASCLCYSGLAWKPSSFDNAWSSCVKYYSTAVPTRYASITAAGLTTNPCALAGDVRAGVTSSSAAASTPVPTTTPTITSEQSAATTTIPTTTTSRNAGNKQAPRPIHGATVLAVMIAIHIF